MSAQHGFMPCKHMYQSLVAKNCSLVFFSFKRILNAHMHNVYGNAYMSPEIYKKKRTHTKWTREEKRTDYRCTELQSEMRKPSKLYGIPFSSISTVWCLAISFLLYVIFSSLLEGNVLLKQPPSIAPALLLDTCHYYNFFFFWCSSFASFSLIFIACIARFSLSVCSM